jgi:RloB-like protein
LSRSIRFAEAAPACRACDRRTAHGSAGRETRSRTAWCVFDIEEHPNVPDAVTLARRHGINLAISNPCLELWFVLHFEDRTAYIDRFEAQHRAKALLNCDKILTEAALATLAERHSDAVTRASKLDEKHRGDGSPPGSNPSTSIGPLIDLIRQA